jgi:hypothetical protein
MIRFRLVGALMMALLFYSGVKRADNGPAHRVPTQQFGSSGGNVNDISRSFCCSGTLGSLVQDNAGAKYILSNNHVLARSDQGKVGEDISQPGLIDNNCQAAAIVADLSPYPRLSSNVDAAVAQLRCGATDCAMDPNGSILDIGQPSTIIRAPEIGLSVAKSGRTTGFTTGTISSINATVNVQYQRGCGVGKKFTVKFTDQVVVGGSGFSAGGDSGSLIVTNDLCHQPVALLFAGSSTMTIGNPIGEVLAKVSAALGRSVSFVGTACQPTTSPNEELALTQRLAPSREAIGYAISVLRDRVKGLMQQPSVIGVGVGALESNPAEVAIVVYVDQTAGERPRLPKRIRGVPVRAVYTDPFVAF